MNILKNLKTRKINNMKTLYFYILIGLLTVVSCKTNENPESEKVSFEIYETLSRNEVPNYMLEELLQMNIGLNSDTLSPIIAYVKIDSKVILSEIFNDNVKFLQTARPVDNDKKFIAIVAVKKQSDLNISNIKKAKANQNNVEIYFNQQGAKKWADLTKNNIGKLIAFTIDNEIYTLTSVNGEIKNGTAIINGLENNNTATKISKSINSSL